MELSCVDLPVSDNLHAGSVYHQALLVFLMSTVRIQAESLLESARPLYHGRTFSLLRSLNFFHQIEKLLFAMHP